MPNTDLHAARLTAYYHANEVRPCNLHARGPEGLFRLDFGSGMPAGLPQDIDAATQGDGWSNGHAADQAPGSFCHLYG